MPARALATCLTLLLGCTPQAAQTSSEPPPRADAPSPAAGATALPWPNATACAAAARTAPGDPKIDQELRTMVGGHFAVDHIGPEAYEAIVAHVAREPDAFLDATARIGLDPATRVDSYWNNVLERTQAVRPERTRELAACMLARIRDTLADPPADRDEAWAARVASHAGSLYVTWRGRPGDGKWRLEMPSRACTTKAGSVETLEVTVDCTCGERVLCEVAAGPGRLDAMVTLDLTAPAVCDDCYAATGTCTVPIVESTEPPPLTINGLTMPLAPCSR